MLRVAVPFMVLVEVVTVPVMVTCSGVALESTVTTPLLLIGALVVSLELQVTKFVRFMPLAEACACTVLPGATELLANVTETVLTVVALTRKLALAVFPL